MIMKYDKMIEITQAESRRKMEVAKKVIAGMLDNMERITVAELVKRTGLPAAYELFHALAVLLRRDVVGLAGGVVHVDVRAAHQADEHRALYLIMDKELEDTMVDLKLELLKAKTQNEELAKSNEQLRQQVEKLQKQLGRKEISLLKRL